MISDDTAKLLVRDGVLDKTLEGKALSDEEKSILYEQALINWAVDKRQEEAAEAKRVKKALKEEAERAAEAKAKEKPLGT